MPRFSFVEEKQHMAEVPEPKELKGATWARARLGGLSQQGLYNLCKPGPRPLPHVKVGRLIRYDPDQLDAWIAAGGCSKAATDSDTEK